RGSIVAGRAHVSPSGSIWRSYEVGFWRSLTFVGWQANVVVGLKITISLSGDVTVDVGPGRPLSEVVGEGRLHWTTWTNGSQAMTSYCELDADVLVRSLLDLLADYLANE